MSNQAPQGVGKEARRLLEGEVSKLAAWHQFNLNQATTLELILEENHEERVNVEVEARSK